MFKAIDSLAMYRWWLLQEFLKAPINNDLEEVRKYLRHMKECDAILEVIKKG